MLPETIKSLNGEGIHIAVLDSGVYREHPIFKKTDIKEYCVFNESVSHVAPDNYGHGTAVLSVLSQLIDKASFHVFKIYENDDYDHCDRMIDALEYIYHNLSCDIIHLSIGTEVYNERLYRICNLIRSKGIVIVSAFDNSGCVSFPAAFDCVIGVDSTDYCNTADEYIYVKNDIVNILVKEGNQRIAWKNPPYKISKGNSFASPFITAIIARLIQYGVTEDRIYEYLESFAFEVIENKSNINTIKTYLSHPVKSVAVFPFNKEIHGLINFADQLDFKIDSVYDVKESGNVNKSIRGIYGNENIIIKNIDSADFNQIDSIIIGHLGAISNKCRTDFKATILNKCLVNKTNVYCLDNYLYDEYKELFYKANLVFSVPYLPNIRNMFGNMYSIGTPVLGIYGTSSKQGKFTLQMILRKRFINDGYHVCQLGTEPTSLLLGFDFMYPYGYNGIVESNEENNILILNQMMYEMSLKNPDIIITGAQSGTVPILYGNTGHIPTKTLTFLLGTLPDAVVLVVNPNDSDDIILRTISVIENLSFAKVIAICLFVYDFINGWDIMNESKRKVPFQLLQKKKKEIKERTGIDVFIHNYDEDMEGLYEKCISFFSEDIIDGE